MPVPDIANTYLLLKLQYSDSSIDIADMYMTQFCAATDTKKSYVTGWLPIVAAARMAKNQNLMKKNFSNIG